MKNFFYKYGLIMFLMVAISVLAFQKEANEIVPNQHMVITVRMSMGLVPVILKKGLLNKNNEGDTWITLETFKKLSNIPKQKLKIDNRHTFEVKK
jgi:hypothetical protein